MVYIFKLTINKNIKWSSGNLFPDRYHCPDARPCCALFEGFPKLPLARCSPAEACSHLPEGRTYRCQQGGRLGKNPQIITALSKHGRTAACVPAYQPSLRATTTGLRCGCTQISPKRNLISWAQFESCKCGQLEAGWSLQWTQHRSQNVLMLPLDQV